MMTHDRIKLSRKVLRFNLRIWIRDAQGQHLLFETAIETTTYGTGKTFVAVDAEGLFFTMIVDENNWGQPMHSKITRRLQEVYRRHQDLYEGCSGGSVIPEQKLSTGPQE